MMLKHKYCISSSFRTCCRPQNNNSY